MFECCGVIGCTKGMESNHHLVFVVVLHIRQESRVNCMCGGTCPGVGATALTCESNSGPKDEGRYPSDALIDSSTRPPPFVLEVW